VALIFLYGSQVGVFAFVHRLVAGWWLCVLFTASWQAGGCAFVSPPPGRLMALLLFTAS
jgi:hypothetical protein